MKKNSLLALFVLCFSTYQAVAQRANLDREAFEQLTLTFPQNQF